MSVKHNESWNDFEIKMNNDDLNNYDMRITKFESLQVLLLKKMMYDQRSKKINKSINDKKKKFEMLKKF